MLRAVLLSPVLGVSLLACGAPAPPAPAQKPAAAQPVTTADATTAGTTVVSAGAAGAATSSGTATLPGVASGTPATPRPDTAGWQSFADGERYGFKDAKGTVVLPARYELVQEFTPGGMACVVDAGAWVCIDGRGAELLRPFIVDNGPDGFAEGVARFVDGGKLGFFDETGARVIAPRLDFARPFAGGRAAFCAGCTRECEAGGEHCSVVGGKWGLIDRSGNEVVAPRFDEIGDLEAGAADAVLDGKAVRVDADGRPLVDKK